MKIDRLEVIRLLRFAMKCLAIMCMVTYALKFLFGGNVLFAIFEVIGVYGLATSLVTYFRIRCPRCDEKFIRLFTLNTEYWINPKGCNNCGLPLNGKFDSEEAL